MSTTRLRARNEKVQKLTLVNKLNSACQKFEELKRPCFDIYNPIKVIFSHKNDSFVLKKIGQSYETKTWYFFHT